MTSMDIDDDDPIVAEYNVYITPDADETQLYVLQYLNHPPELPFTKANESQPSELRIKKQSGFLEVDVPINIGQNYDRLAGVRWGEAMRKTKGFGQKAFGIAAGFERVMPRSSTRTGASDGTPASVTVEDEDNLEEYVSNFKDANEKGHVLNTQTFGGQVIHDGDKGPSYMLGTFQHDQLHLTQLNGLIQLRTQFHHIDASAQLEAVHRRREKESQEGAKPIEPKAFLPAIKKTGADTAAELVQAFLKSANQESWMKLHYFDENTEKAFDSYNDQLFFPDTSTASKLHSSLSNDQFLDVISAPSSSKGEKRRVLARRDIEDIIELSDESEEEKIGETKITEPSADAIEKS